MRRDAVGTRGACGENVGSGCAGSGAQSLRASVDLHETGPHDERRVSGEVRDGQDLVAQRRAPGARRPCRRCAPSPARPCAAGGRPGRSRPRRGSAPAGRVFGHASGTCIFSWSSPSRERQLLEGGGGLGEEHGVERVVGPVRQRDLDGRHAELADRLERGAVHVGRRALVHPRRDVADLEALHRTRSRRSRDGSARSRGRPGPGPRSPRARASRPRRRASSGRACRATSTASSRRCAARGRRSGAVPSTPQRIAGIDDAAAGLAADGEGDERRRGRRARARRWSRPSPPRGARGSSSGRRTRRRSGPARRARAWRGAPRRRSGAASTTAESASGTRLRNGSAP